MLNCCSIATLRHEMLRTVILLFQFAAFNPSGLLRSAIALRLIGKPAEIAE
jgi:hypothetical protein